MASPLFADGTLQSIAIPDKRSSVTYAQLVSDPNPGKLASHLSGGTITGRTRVHLDPDLDALSLPRPKDWRPLFGQCGAAQSHLHKHGVTEGDLFLFFGWFKSVDFVRRKWRYVPASPDLHIIFGWLQIGQIFRVANLVADCNERERNRQPDWIQYHPHCQGNFSGENTIYQAASSLTLPGGRSTDHDGAGVFADHAKIRQLTAPGRNRSIWSLPGWMHPKGRRSTLSYHGDPSRWRKSGTSTELRSVARGQEFVLDLDHYPEAADWLMELFDG